MLELDKFKTSDKLDKNDNASQIKDAERIKYEESEEGIEEYKKKKEEQIKIGMSIVDNKLKSIKDDIVKFEEAEKIGFDGGIRYTDMPKDSAGRKLTNREILFARYYVATNNEMQALKLAGYTQRDRLLINNPAIRAYIAELTDYRLKKLGYDRNTVIKNLAIIANQDVADYMKITKTSVTTTSGATYIRDDIEVKDLDEINKEYLTDEYGDYVLDTNGNKIIINSEKSKAIKSIKYNDNNRVVIEFHDKLTALKQLANMLDMESPQKITLNDETHRAETEKALLNKLKAFADNVNNSNSEADTQTEKEDTSDNDKESAE